MRNEKAKGPGVLQLGYIHESDYQLLVSKGRTVSINDLQTFDHVEDMAGNRLEDDGWRSLEDFVNAVNRWLYYEYQDFDDSILVYDYTGDEILFRGRYLLKSTTIVSYQIITTTPDPLGEKVSY